MVTKLKLLLVHREILQVDLSRDTGISEPKLSRIVRGRVEPSADETRRLADVLGVDVEEILQD